MLSKYALIYAGLAGLATILGTVLILVKEGWSRQNSIYLVSFAAGVLLATTFIHIIPESNELYPHASWMVLIGVLIFYLIEQVIMLHPCHDEACEIHRLGILSLTGLTFHSFLDGLVIVVGFEASPTIGIITTLGVILHELPEGITTTGILLHASMARSQVVIYSLLVAIATPLGAFLSYPLVKGLSSRLLGILLALAAGSFIYISVADLIPETHRKNNRANAAMLMAGVATLLLVGHLIKE